MYLNMKPIHFRVNKMRYVGYLRSGSGIFRPFDYSDWMTIASMLEGAYFECAMFN